MLNMASEKDSPNFPKAYLSHCLKYLHKIVGLCLNMVDKAMDKFSEETEVEGGRVIQQQQ